MSGAGRKLICRGIATKNDHIVATSEKITIFFSCYIYILTSFFHQVMKIKFKIYKCLDYILDYKYLDSMDYKHKTRLLLRNVERQIKPLGPNLNDNNIRRGVIGRGVRYWGVVDLGALLWNVEEHGEVWWNVVERVGQMWTMHEIMEALGEQIFPLYICR